MSELACAGCGSEWFRLDKRVKIADAPHSGSPRYTDGVTVYLCLDCGEPLDVAGLEHKPPELSVIEGDYPLTRTLP